MKSEKLESPAVSPMKPLPDREEMIRTTRYGNSAATTFSYLGFLASATQGTMRAVLQPQNVPSIANTLFMPIARFSYNGGSAVRSYTRYSTTNPDRRDNPEARLYAKLSNGFSMASMLHGAVTATSILLPEKVVGKFPTGSLLSTSLKYLRGPGFNMTALLGIMAAQAYNYSEKLETDTLIAWNAQTLSKQESIPLEEAEKIAKSSIPHMSDGEYMAKSAAFLSCGIAAGGGLLGVLPILALRYTGLTSKLGAGMVQKMADIGGRMNGAFYASWPLFVAATHEGYNSEERRLPKHLEGMWNNLRKQAFLETLGIAALTAGAMLTFVKAKDGSKLKRVADIMLNKMDVIAGGGMGSWFLWSAFRDRAPSLKDGLSGMLEQNPLLSSAFFARSVWIGPRLGINKETAKYLDNTDHSLPEEIRETYIRTTAENLPPRAKGSIGNLDGKPVTAIRSVLEDGVLSKVANSEMAVEGIPSERPIHPSACYAAEMRRKATSYKDGLLREQQASKAAKVRVY